MPLTDIPYPSISILPQRVTKYDIAERIGNYLIPQKLPEKLKNIRELLFDDFVGSDDGLDKYSNKVLEDHFLSTCIESTENCQVSATYMSISRYLFEKYLSYSICKT